MVASSSDTMNAKYLGCEWFSLGGHQPIIYTFSFQISDYYHLIEPDDTISISLVLSFRNGTHLTETKRHRFDRSKNKMDTLEFILNGKFVYLRGFIDTLKPLKLILPLKGGDTVFLFPSLNLKTYSEGRFKCVDSRFHRLGVSTRNGFLSLMKEGANDSFKLCLESSEGLIVYSIIGKLERYDSFIINLNNLKLEKGLYFVIIETDSAEVKLIKLLLP